MTETVISTKPTESTALRPPYGWAAVAGGLVFLLYVITLARTTAFWDTSEYIATAQIMGIPHPPGNPLFVVLARAWTVLLEPTGLSVAVRVNLFSAFMSATAHAFWFLVIHHVLRSFSSDRRFRLVGAFTAVLVSATAFTVWNQSNVNEKVYTVSLFTIALLSWLVIRWQERLGRGGDDNLLVLMAFILGLSDGNHRMALLAAPAVVVFVSMVNPRVWSNWKLYPSVMVAAFVGLSVNLFLPLRADLQPVINEAAPACESVTEALMTVGTYAIPEVTPRRWRFLGRWRAQLSEAGCEPLSAALSRQQYKVEGQPGPGLLGPRNAPVSAQYANYFQYFGWQWARSVQGTDVVYAPMRQLFTFLFLMLGAFGIWEHFRRDPESFAYVGTLFATLSVGLVWYLNFKHGYSLGDVSYEFREVRERDYFFIASFSVWGLWAGVGIAGLWQSLAEMLQDAGAQLTTALRKASPVLLLGLIPLTLNFSWATRSYDYAARDWAYNLLMSVEPYGLLFTNGDNDTFPLWYLQEAEGIRRDVSVVVTSYLNTGWYAKQIRDITRPCEPGVEADDDPTRIICQRDYTADNTGGMYTHDPSEAEAAGKVPLLVDAPVERPASGLLELDDDIIDRVAGAYVPMPEGRVIDLGSVQAVFRPGEYLVPWQQFALSMIRESLEDNRPVYFASSGSTAPSIGLGGYLVREGLAYRLTPEVVTDTLPDDIVRVPVTSPYIGVTGAAVRLDRTRTLAEEVFIHRSDLPDWDHWPDHSTTGIPHYYSWLYLALAETDAEADDATFLRYQDLATRWTQLGTPQ